MKKSHRKLSYDELQSIIENKYNVFPPIDQMMAQEILDLRRQMIHVNLVIAVAKTISPHSKECCWEDDCGCNNNVLKQNVDSYIEEYGE